MAVPVLDLFGLPHGRPVPYASAVTHGPGGRRASTPTCPMPFRERIEITFTNHGDATDDALLPGRLHAAARAARGARLPPRRRSVARTPPCSSGTSSSPRACAGPGRYPRLRHRRARDRPRQLVRRGRGEGVPGRRHRPAHHLRHRAGGLRRHGVGHGPAPCAVRRRAARRAAVTARGPRAWAPCPTSSSFYRWHLPDPIMFERDLRGHDPADRRRCSSSPGQEADARGVRRGTNPVAGEGWRTDGPPGLLAWGICRARRRLQLHVVRVLPGSAGGARRRRGRRPSPTSRDSTTSSRISMESVAGG